VKVEVKLFATLANYLPESSDGGSPTVEIPDGSTVRQLVRSLGIPDRMPSVILVNGRDAAPDQVLEDGDLLTLFPPLVGGAGRAPIEDDAGGSSGFKSSQLPRE